LNKIILSFCCLLAFPFFQFAHAQNFRYTQYTTTNDLPSDNVYCAAQDNYGFLYFGTDFGLVKYDGFKFTHYSNKEGLINKPITDMVYAGGDSILFASYPDALQTIHADGRINTIINKIELGFSIQQIVKHHNSYYLFQRFLPNYGVLENGRLTKLRFDTITGIPDIQINCIVSLPENQLAFCTNHGLFVMGNNKLLHVLQDEPLARAILTRNRQLLIAGNKKIFRLDPQLRETILPYQLPAGFSTLHMEEDNSGAVWFRGLDKGIFRLTVNGLSDMTAKLRMENYAINEFYKDSNGSFWICTNGGGLLFIAANQAEIYSTQEGLINNKVQRLLALPGQLWIGTQNGLSLKQGSAITSPSLPKADNGLQYIHKLFIAAPGITGISITNASAFDKDTSRLSSLVKDVRIDKKLFRLYNGLFAWQENDSIAWLHKSRGFPLVRINIRTNKRDYYDLSAHTIRKFFTMIAYEGSYWLGSDNGILKLRDNQFQKIDTINGEKLKQVTDFLVDAKNQLWVSTDIGLFSYKTGQFTTLPKASSYGGNYCTSLSEDDKGRIWASSWYGIFSTSGQERNYYSNSSGLPSRIINSIHFDKTEGKMYVGTDNGLTVFPHTPESVTFNQPVFIHATLGENAAKVIVDGAKLQPTQNDLGIYLSIPYYEGHDDISYEYKLDNNNWIDQKSPQLNFSNLAGGSHVLTVRPRIKNLNRTGTETAFHFEIKIPLYKKGWFIILSLLLLQAIIIVIINQVIKKRKQKQLKQQLALQQQMLEQASLKQQAFTALLNPHFIFNALNSVQHFINQQDRQNANRYLSDFASLIRKNFDASQQTFIPLEAEQENLRLYLQLEKMRFGDKINYSISTAEDLDTDNWMLPTMILQPFLENAILHGLMPATNSGELHIHFAQNQKKELLITIADNGIGMEKSRQLRSGKSHASKGMQLIKERLQLLGKLTGHTITLTITDQYPGAENPGTLVTLLYPEEVYTTYMRLQN